MGQIERIKALIHIHTNYSPDSDVTLSTLEAYAKREGVDCLAVTDHDTIEGAQALAGSSDLQVIVGEEVTTRDGHLIGLFLEERIRPEMSALDTARAIREQGGLVLAPHPFVKAFGCGLGETVFEIADLLDAVEVNNAQNFFSAPDHRAEAFAEERGLPKYVGSDSHLAMSIAPCFQMMPTFSGRDDFLDSLRQAELFRGRHGFAYFVAMALYTARYFSRIPIPNRMGVNSRWDYRETNRREAASPGCAGSLVDKPI